MFHHEDASVPQQIAFEDKFRHFGQFFQGIRGICKDEIKTLGRSRMEITEDIAANQCQRIRFQLFGDFGDKGGMCIILFDSRHAPAFARKQFERNASRTRKQVERIHPLKIDMVGDHIEDIFLRKVRRRTGAEGRRDIKTSPSVYSTYNSHNDRAIRSNGACNTSGPIK